jgi:hypothetical protein
LAVFVYRWYALIGSTARFPLAAAGEGWGGEAKKYILSGRQEIAYHLHRQAFLLNHP